jgi:hypothetical protein
MQCYAHFLEKSRENSLEPFFAKKKVLLARSRQEGLAGIKPWQILWTCQDIII